LFCPPDEEDGQMMSHGLKWKLSAQNTDHTLRVMEKRETAPSWGLQDLWASVMFRRAATSRIAVQLWRLHQFCVQRSLSLLWNEVKI
jgi:hypothetical protein